MTATQINILPFYTSLQLQHQNRRYAYGSYYCQPTPVGQLIPFQHRRENTGASVSELEVIELSTGTATNILPLASASGLEVVEYAADGYDLIIFPATTVISGFNVGRHYVRMVDSNSNEWFSEVFNFVDNTTDLVKVEWWNDGDFCYPSGSIRYNYPYKSRLYLKSNIGKPEYPFDFEIAERNGKNFKLKGISSKLYKFSALMPEYVIDALRTVALHDFVEITNGNDGRTYTVDEINMNAPDWQKTAALASVTLEFQTDTVIVKSGSGVTSLTYEAGPGECLPLDYTAEAEVTENTLPYQGFYYVSESSGEIVEFVNDDYVLIINASTFKRELFRYSSADVYVPQSPSNNEIIYDANSGLYYFYDTDEFVLPRLSNYTAGTLNGQSYPNTLVNIYAWDGSTSELQETITAAQLAAGYPITFPGGTISVYFVASSPACPELYMSNYLRTNFDTNFGVGYDTIETDLQVY